MQMRWSVDSAEVLLGLTLKPGLREARGTEELKASWPIYSVFDLTSEGLFRVEAFVAM